LVVAALLIPIEFGTGTEVALNLSVFMTAALLGLWLFRMAVVERNIAWVPSPVNRPLLLFLVASLVSFAVGRLTWDPFVPVSANFWLVQMAQWSIFAFSAGAFWLTANQVRSEAQLRQLTLLFLLVAGSVAILRMVPGLGGPINRVTTIAFIRAPLWMLLSALAGGQLLFNRGLTRPWRVFMWAVILCSVYFGFFINRDSSSTWVGIGAALGVLIWLRFARLRLPIVVLALALLAAGVLFPAVYEFAGGDDAWRSTGGSRLALIGRVVEVTLRNPVTGLGPAAYRPYANMKPLPYLGAYWVDPLINSHNNYVDLFAHGGVLGLALFAWFAWEVYRLGLRLYRRYQEGFAAGYVNGMLAAGAGSLVIMLMADWILPFVYNIGFPGFQASVLVWLFLGGLVALERMNNVDPER
jgi:hypothetical protein